MKFTVERATLVRMIKQCRQMRPYSGKPDRKLRLWACQARVFVEAMRAVSQYLFASPHDPAKPRDASAVRHRLTAVCRKLKLGHVTPHGLRSYFVTEARQFGLTDAEIAALIGDKSGPALIATTYGDLRPDHLLAQARRIRHTVASDGDETSAKASHKASHTLLEDSDTIHHDSVCEEVA